MKSQANTAGANLGNATNSASVEATRYSVFGRYIDQIKKDPMYLNELVKKGANNIFYEFIQQQLSFGNGKDIQGCFIDPKTGEPRAGLDRNKQNIAKLQSAEYKKIKNLWKSVEASSQIEIGGRLYRVSDISQPVPNSKSLVALLVAYSIYSKNALNVLKATSILVDAGSANSNSQQPQSSAPSTPPNRPVTQTTPGNVLPTNGNLRTNRNGLIAGPMSLD